MSARTPTNCEHCKIQCAHPCHVIRNLAVQLLDIAIQRDDHDNDEDDNDENSDSKDGCDLVTQSQTPSTAWVDEQVGRGNAGSRFGGLSGLDCDGWRGCTWVDPG